LYPLSEYIAAFKFGTVVARLIPRSYLSNFDLSSLALPRSIWGHSRELAPLSKCVEQTRRILPLLLLVVLLSCKSEEDKARDYEINQFSEAFMHRYGTNFYGQLPEYNDTLKAINDAIKRGDYTCPAKGYYQCDQTKLFDYSTPQPYLLMDEFLIRLKERYPTQAKAIEEDIARQSSSLPSYRAPTTEADAEARTRDCMESEYRKAYRDGKTLAEGKEAAIVECAGLLNRN
jgi:hypothetical protein